MRIGTRAGGYVIAFAAALAFAAPVALLSEARAQSDLPPTRISDLAKPATVMIRAHFQARVTVPDMQPADGPLDDLASRAAAMLRRGELHSEEEARAYVIQEMLDAPLTYFQPGSQTQSVEVKIQATGSGFLVTPDGYVVTNAHVAAPKDDDLKEQLALTGLKDILASDLEQITTRLRGQPQQALVEKIKAALARFYAHHMELHSLRKEVAVFLGTAGRGASEGRPAEVVMAGTPIPGKDVAVLKIEGRNLPTLPLESRLPHPGARLFVLGYPGAATFHPIIAQESETEPSFTAGTVSAIKTTREGWQVVQTDTAISHGNSGGPALDGQGAVVGLATFGSVDPQTGEAVAGMNFIVPTGVVREFLDRQGIRPVEGRPQSLYRRALVEAERKHYRVALSLLRELRGLNPGFPYLPTQIGSAEQAIAAGQDRSWETWAPYTLALGALGLLGLGAGWSIRRRRVSQSGGFTLKLSSGRRVALRRGGRVLAAAVPGLHSSAPDGVVAEISPNPTDPSLLGLTNRSTRGWKVTMVGGTVRPVAPGQTVRLVAGARIDFGSVVAEVEA